MGVAAFTWVNDLNVDVVIACNIRLAGIMPVVCVPKLLVTDRI